MLAQYFQNPNFLKFRKTLEGWQFNNSLATCEAAISNEISHLISNIHYKILFRRNSPDPSNRRDRMLVWNIPTEYDVSMDSHVDIRVYQGTYVNSWKPVILWLSIHCTGIREARDIKISLPAYPYP